MLYSTVLTMKWIFHTKYNELSTKNESTEMVSRERKNKINLKNPFPCVTQPPSGKLFRIFKDV